MLEGIGPLITSRNIVEYMKHKGIPVITGYTKAF